MTARRTSPCEKRRREAYEGIASTAARAARLTRRNGHILDSLPLLAKILGKSPTCYQLSLEVRETPCRKCNINPATHLYLITCSVVCPACFTGSWRRDVPPEDGHLSPSTRARYGARYPFPLREARQLIDRDTVVSLQGLLRKLEDYVPLAEAHVLEHCKDVGTRKELRAVVPHILSLPARYRKGGKEVAGCRRVKLYDTRALRERYKVDECYCMRNLGDVMKRYQAVVALREETEEERESDMPVGWVGDPFKPSWRAVHMN